MSSNVRPESMERITTPALANAFIAQQIEEIRAQVGIKKVLLALSGGVDSSGMRFPPYRLPQHTPACPPPRGNPAPGAGYRHYKTTQR